MYSNCATALDAMGEYEQAVEMLEQAIRLSRLHANSDPEHLASLYTNLGAVRSNQGVCNSCTVCYCSLYVLSLQVNQIKLAGHMRRG